ncbi:MAG TPA: MFS transporter, partial [Chitinophagaceae bacterium]|nr:MFS transporter [Chitinophagaceae bacterium]
SLNEAGLMMGLFGCGSFVGGYLGGRLTDAIGFFYVQVISLLCNGLLFILLGYLQSLWAIGLCIFVLSSLGEAFRPANAAAIAAYCSAENCTRCYSLNRLAINLGWAIGPAVGGLLASYTYKLLFWTDGLTCISAAVLLHHFLARYQTTNHPETKPATPTFSKAHADSFYLICLLLLFLIGVSFFQLFSIIPVYYKTVVRLSEGGIGCVLALNGLLIALVEMVLVYRIQNRRSDFHYIVFGAFLTGLSFLLLTVSPVIGVVLAAMLTVTFGEMFLLPFTNNLWINRSTESNRGQYAAFYTMTFAVSQVLAPTGASQVVRYFSYNTLFVIDFLLCAGAALGFYVLYKQTLQHGTVQYAGADALERP